MSGHGVTPELEAVAAGIFDAYMAHGLGSVATSRTWAGLSRQEREFGLQLARGALKPIREPTAAMQRALVGCYQADQAINTIIDYILGEP